MSGLVFACLYPLALGWCSFDVIGVLAGVGPFVIVLDGVGISIHAGVGRMLGCQSENKNNAL